MTESELRQFIRETIKEASQTGTGASFSAGDSEAYATPFAFSRKGKNKATKYMQKLGYHPSPLNEVSYREYRKSTDATPRQKIGNSMRMVEKKLNEIEKLIKYNKKLKEDMGMGSGKYWESTRSTLARLSEKIKSLNNDILQLGN